jgi:acyl dehydratase
MSPGGALVPMTVEEGEVRTYERTFTDEDVRQFAAVSGDTGRHHVERDAEGRLMAHGLLTATLPTKIGGDLNFVASEMTFAFHRPVYAGDTVTCEAEMTRVVDDGDRTRLTAEFVCHNQDGDRVMSGRSEGVIPG